jgi:hypothetical protein
MGTYILLIKVLRINFKKKAMKKTVAMKYSSYGHFGRS